MNGTNKYHIGCMAYIFLCRDGWHPEDAENEVFHILSLMSREDLENYNEFLRKYSRVGCPGYIRRWGEKVSLGNRLRKKEIFLVFLNAGNHAQCVVNRSLAFNQFAIAYLTSVRPFDLYRGIYRGIADAI